MKFKTICERVRQNNGICEVLFIKRAVMGDEQSHEEQVLFNIHCEPDHFKVGQYYWVEVVMGIPG